MGGFINTILVVVFNYSHCVELKSYLYSLYKPYFKQIIFYSDVPTVAGTDDVHYIDIHRGFFTHRIFEHFYRTYASLITESDGVFYTMDDNIINAPQLWRYSTDKIIYPAQTLKPLSSYSGWQWEPSTGRVAITRLMSDTRFNALSTPLFSGAFADYFYLPTRYWTERLVTLFSLYAEYRVFLELAIPSVIGQFEQDTTQYSKYSETILWGTDRNKTWSRSYVMDVLTRDLFLHPLKFKVQPEAKEWLTPYFKKNTKAIVITTINPPTKQIHYYSTQSDWDLIVVGDTKTPAAAYDTLKCIYIGIEEQKELFPTLFDKIPVRSYTRKMFGYLYAMKFGYTVIYDTDDDNQTLLPLDAAVASARPIKQTTTPGFVNLYSCFTKSPIWPRGIPPGHSSIAAPVVLEDVSTDTLSVAVIQGLVNNDPDVDAYYRLNVNSGPFTFELDPGVDIILGKSSVCPFNTQNTYWIEPSVFYLMYLPTTVTFRYTDILRGFVSTHQLWRESKTIKFTGPTAIQERNEHDLQKDFESEEPMYASADKVISLINSNPGLTIAEVYSLLCENGIVSTEELPVLCEWLRLCEQFVHLE
jgi:hypothetical protein